jgi:hypothetical protein
MPNSTAASVVNLAAHGASRELVSETKNIPSPKLVSIEDAA